MPWIIVAVLGTVLVGIVAQRQPSAPSRVPIAAQPGRALPPPVEVRRALPVPVPKHQIGEQRITTMPDGSVVATTFKGYLSDVSQLPIHSGQLGDMWAIGQNLWVLTTPADSYRVGWVDPPGDQGEVRRALPVDSVEVRRAKMVVPRAELVRELSD
jgi:hypothetical protein